MLNIHSPLAISFSAHLLWLKLKNMNEQEFKNRVEERCGSPEMRGRGRTLTGVLILSIGVLLSLKVSNIVLFPHWFFSWPMLLIGIGIVSGIRHRFRGFFWFILLLIGGLSLADRIDPTLNMDKYNWPIVFILIGLTFILRPKSHERWRRWRRHHYGRWEREPSVSNENVTGVTEAVGDYDSRDFIDITAVFGGVKKTVLSKKFKGGEITCFMGGGEIDLSQADFNGTIRIDVTNIFGGTKLIVPPTWDVQNDIGAVFGGIDDKRQISGVTMDYTKTLILDGTCIFGGVEIRSF